MSRNIYLKSYRLSSEGAAPRPVAEIGVASTFKATDTRSGAPVLLTLIPVAAIQNEDREKFEAKARAIAQFDHPHVARTVDFGQEDDEYAFVSEYPRGATTEEWVSEHGPMPPEAVLRLAIQVVSFIAAAVYHQIVHQGIRPGNIVITPGQMAEGGWPSIKLVNLATGGTGAAGTAAPDLMNFASPETLKDGVSDFRSEIYSLGATMCFLLTGAFDSAGSVSSQTSRLAGPLRKLIQPMLRPNPDERPQDLEATTENLRTALQTVERRQLLARRVGIPFLAVRARTGLEKPLPPLPKQLLAPIGESPLPPAAVPDGAPEPDIPVRRRWSPAFAIAAALLLGLGIIGAAVIPARHLFFSASDNNKSGEIGVPVGVSQPAPVWEGRPLVMNKDRIASASASASPSVAPTEVPLPSSNSVAANEPAASAAPSLSDSKAVAEATPPEPAAPAQGPQSLWEKSGNRPLSERIVTKEGTQSANHAEKPNDDENEEPAQETPANAGDRKITSSANDRNQSTTDTQKPATNSGNARPRLRPGDSVSAHKAGRQMTGHGSVARIAPDGSVILRLPNGETAILPPPRDELPARRRYHPRRTYPPDYSTNEPSD